MKLLTPSEVAEMLGVNVDTVKRYSRSGELVGLQLGGRWKYQLADIEDFINKQKEITKQAINNSESTQIVPQEVATSPMPTNTLEKLIEQTEPTIALPVVPTAEQELGANMFPDVLPVTPVNTEDPMEIILQMKSQKIKYNAIAKHLNELGLKTKRGKEWTSDIITNELKKLK